MPQLMPLNWIISSMIMVLIMVSSCMIFSEKSEKDNLFIFKKGTIKKKKLWYW